MKISLVLKSRGDQNNGEEYIPSIFLRRTPKMHGERNKQPYSKEISLELPNIPPTQ